MGGVYPDVTVTLFYGRPPLRVIHGTEGRRPTSLKPDFRFLLEPVDDFTN